MTIERELRAAVGGERGVIAADRLCQACVSLLDVEAAAISVVYDGVNVGTLGASGAKGRVYDELQFTLGEGPCLDSVANRAAVMIVDLAAPDEVRWPMYVPAMLAHRIRGVSAMPVAVAGEFIGALDLFRADPGPMGAEQLAGAMAAAELAQLPMLDLLDVEMQAAANDPESDAWADLHALARAEVGQASGMVMAQLNIGPTEAVVRLRAHAYATGRSATEVARDIIDRRLRLEAN